MPATQIFTRPKPGLDNTAADYEPFLARPRVTQSVYTKTTWSGPWVHSPHLHCLDAAWSEGQSLSTATLVWRYGRIAQPGQSTFADVGRLLPNRQFVKVVFSFPRGGANREIRWYGVVDVDHDELLNARPSGVQTITCYGLEKLLAESPILWSVVRRVSSDPPARVLRPLAFNRNGVANCVDGLVDGYFFAMDPATVEYWSSDSIVQYTLKQDGPWGQTGTYSEQKITFSLKDDDPGGKITPYHDRPTIERINRTALDILRQIYTPARLLGFRVWVDPADDDIKSADGNPATSTTVRIVPISFAAASITSPIDTLPANPNQVHLITDYDQSASIPRLARVAIRKRDQTIYRGERVTSTFSDPFDPWQVIVKGWSIALEDEYDAGASTAVDYAGLSIEAKRRRNELARSSKKFEDVWCRFAIRPYYTGAIGGESIFPYLPVAPTQELPYHGLYDPETFVLSSIPLKSGVDYSGTKIADGTFVENPYASGGALVNVNTGPHLPPMYHLKCVEYVTEDRYVPIERNGEFNNALPWDTLTEWLQVLHSWSASVSVDGEDRAFRLHVSGAPQWILGDFPGGYQGHGDDAPRVQTDYSYLDGEYTIALEGQFYCEGRYPADESLPTVDVLRREVVDAPGFRLDWVADQTVVGCDPKTGILQRTSGSGFIRDDREVLESLAQMAHEFANEERRVLEVSTENLDERIHVGVLLTELGDPVGTTLLVNTVITQILIQTPFDTGAPRVSYTTAAGDLDPLRLIRP